MKKEALSTELPLWEELPAIPLYMDQVITYLTERLSTFYPNESGYVTSNMVNNYVKNQVLSAPVNKKYSTAHVSKLLLIFLLKKSFSVLQVKSILDFLSQFGDDETQYRTFLSVFQPDPSTVSVPENELLISLSRAVRAKVEAEYILPTPEKPLIDSKSDFKTAKKVAKREYKSAKKEAKMEYKGNKKKPVEEDKK